MTPQFELALLFGAFGAVLMVLSNLMKRIVALRLFAAAANAFFIVHAVLERNWLFCALQTALLMINLYRLWDLRQLLRSLERANADASIKDLLLPQMKKRRYRSGAVLFHEGDPADALYYIQSGTIRSPQFTGTLGAGHLIGEIGLFSGDHRRAATVICETDCVFYTMSDEAVYLLYIENPQIGFYLIRLIIEQLRDELRRRPMTPVFRHRRVTRLERSAAGAALRARLDDVHPGGSMSSRRLFAAAGLAAAFLLVAVPAQAQFSGASLKGLLGNASDAALDKLSQPGAFSADDAIRIALPGKADQLSGLLKLTGKAGLTGDITGNLNRAAEQAAAQAKPIFRSAIDKASMQDAIGIAKGGKTGATDYLRMTSGSEVRTRLLPLVKAALDRAGVLRQSSLLSAVGMDADRLTDYVAGKTSDGIFTYVGREETRLRADPIGTGTELLKGLKF